MKHVTFTVSEAVGGYTIKHDTLTMIAVEDDHLVPDPTVHVATSREGVGKVVVKLCDDAFAESRVPDETHIHVGDKTLVTKKKRSSGNKDA